MHIEFSLNDYKGNYSISSYEKIINDAAKGGWELVMIDTITSIQKPGFLARLFGAKTETATYKLLIFKCPI